MFQNAYKAFLSLFVCSCMSSALTCKDNSSPIISQTPVQEYRSCSGVLSISQENPSPTTVVYSCDELVKCSEDFSNIKYENTVPFVPPINRGKVIKVYDGDTITIAAKLPYPESPIYRISVRLNGIDTPEIKGQTQREKDLAKQIRDILQKKIMNKIVELKKTSSEKYGRLLADVYLDGICINDWMIEQGYAVKYDGGTKERPESWL